MNYKIWGDENIDQGSRKQIQNACDLPISRKAALMPDAHQGYGLPIGGVLATENAVIPYGVGVDIACRMRLTLTDADVRCLRVLDRNNSRECFPMFDRPLERGTRFGLGCEFSEPNDHDVMDHGDWGSTELLQDMKDRAWKQLGTSGGGNHFVEWGIVDIYGDKQYVGLMSHSGSRGTGAKVCHKYTKIAKQKNPAGELSWLNLDTEEGQEYWMSMQLMGEYAQANHDCIHKNVLKLAGLNPVAHYENHHNFAWEEDGLIVHRKGATPAHKGEIGVIPGSMATPAYIVTGLGNEDSICSAAHGAGRAMSRREAKEKFDWTMLKEFLTVENVRLLAGGLDESPEAYKPIQQVMASQKDLVHVMGSFMPKIVMMAPRD